MNHRLSFSLIALGTVCVLCAGMLFTGTLRGQAPPAPQPPAPQQTPAQPAAPEQAGTATPPQSPPKVAAADLSLSNASLNDVVERLGRLLHIVLILPPAPGLVGSISINSYGAVKDLDARNLLDLILRINGYAMVQEGDQYRVFKMDLAMTQPVPLVLNGRDVPADDQLVLDMIFLKYVSVTELTKVLNEFKGESAKIISYEPANLMFILDSGRNLERLRDIIAQFDNDVFTNQRVHLSELKNARPSDLEKQLDTILKGLSLDPKNSTVRFL